MGVMTSNGAVHKAMYDKFKQINRFLEFIDEIAKMRLLTEKIMTQRRNR